MAATGSAGVLAIFFVDFLSLVYISWLGDPTLTAGAGLGAIVLFLATSVNIGLLIAVGALVSRALGAGRRGEARRIAASSLVWSMATGALCVAIMLPLAPTLLALLGARGATADVAMLYVSIVLPTSVAVAIGMGCSGVLRATADARRAMNLTLYAAAGAAILDPILIFGLDMGVTGAAIGMAVSRLIFAGLGLWYVIAVHDMIAWPRREDMLDHFRPYFGIAAPAILANLATPVALIFLAAVIGRFGDEAIAGNAAIERIVPVAFGGLFALSGAVGPIIGQNRGAGRFDRLRAILRDSLLVSAVYVGVVWIGLALGRNGVAALFGASGETRDLIVFFCLVCGPIWFFNGLLFVANASFNNLGFPLYSTAFNWGRATIGTAPLALLGAHFAGPQGAILGAGVGSAAFGAAALLVAFATLRRLERELA
ncbi:MAG: MATE family efflux transporter [Salinarimonadaceae bacterium]|nr:MAG: MATE family efflux transporter [Salinarimonadaceae bacterium]